MVREELHALLHNYYMYIDDSESVVYDVFICTINYVLSSVASVDFSNSLKGIFEFNLVLCLFLWI